MIVHQALYGDKNGAYGLLNTSLSDVELAKRICNVTDLLDRPSNGHLTQPVFRSFAHNDFYLFIKSFPDNDSGVRKGRVLSHTLIVELSDLHLLSDLGQLFSFFPVESDKNIKLEPLLIEDNLHPTQYINCKSREAAAINGLLAHSDYENTLVWIGEEGYQSFITQIWFAIDEKLRSTLKLGIGFNPQRLDNQNLNIIYVIPEYKNKWVSGKFCVIDKENVGELESISSFRLAGYRDQSKSLDNFIKTFGIIPNEIEDFGYIEKAIKPYDNLSNNTDLKLLIVLCDLISKYSPDPKIAKNEKHKLLLEVISRIELATLGQVLILKNPEWKGFLNAHKLIGEEVSHWVEQSLFDTKADNSTINLIVAAFDLKNNAEWWEKSFSEGLKSAFKNWKSIYANSLWQWFLMDLRLVKTLKDFIPTNIQVEADFVEQWQKPQRELAQNIQVLAKERKWFILYGLSSLQMLSSKESIKKQLEIDTDSEYSTALQKMSEQIPDNEFIQLTVEIGELRLIKIAANKIASQPSLICPLDVKNISWRHVWLESIGQGMQPFDFIEEPVQVLFILLEEVINGIDIETKLLLMFSKSAYNNLSSFKQRAEIWEYLDKDVKLGFINATTHECVRLIDNEQVNLNDLESDIQVCLSNAEIISRIITDQTIKASTKIQLFTDLAALKENEFLKFLNGVSFSSNDSKEIGKLIFKRNWNKAAQSIASKISMRNDLKLALIECQSLLSFFARLKLRITEDIFETISLDEWWSAFSEQCYDKYPKGATDKGLWGRSGGKDYDLHTTGTGREIWMDVISKIRNGGTNIDAQKLLQEMLNDYPRSSELKQLIKGYKYANK